MNNCFTYPFNANWVTACQDSLNLKASFACSLLLNLSDVARSSLPSHSSLYLSLLCALQCAVQCSVQGSAVCSIHTALQCSSVQCNLMQFSAVQCSCLLARICMARLWSLAIQPSAAEGHSVWLTVCTCTELTLQ